MRPSPAGYFSSGQLKARHLERQRTLSSSSGEVRRTLRDTQPGRSRESALDRVMDVVSWHQGPCGSLPHDRAHDKSDSLRPFLQNDLSEWCAGAQMGCPALQQAGLHQITPPQTLFQMAAGCAAWTASAIRMTHRKLLEAGAAAGPAGHSERSRATPPIRTF